MLALAKCSKYCPVQLSPLSLFSSLIPMFFLFSLYSPGLLPSPKIYCLYPGPQSPLQAYCLISKPTVYFPSLLRTLQAYCLLSKPTAYSQSLLHTLQAYYILFLLHTL